MSTFRIYTPFPLPAFVPDAEVGPGTLYPVEVEVAKMVKWWALARTWSGSITVSNDSLDQPYTFTGSAAPPASDEADLLSFGGCGVILALSNPAFTDPFSNQTIRVSICKEFTQTAGGVSYPSIVIQGTPGSGMAYQSAYASDSGLTIHAGTVTVDGIAIPIRARPEPLEDPPWLSGTISGSITISDYWPHVLPDGLAVYDTATGSILPGRSPHVDW